MRTGDLAAAAQQLIMYADKTSRNTEQQPPQQDLLLALSFCGAVYGLTFRKRDDREWYKE